MPVTTTMLISEIHHGRGGEGLEHLERELLHRARLAGQFDQADGDRDGGILDGVEKLRSQRRQDDAERHRQQHVAIALRRRQPERGRRLLLPARQRGDAGAQLHGDARRHEQADPDRRRPERRVGQLLQPQPGAARQQFRQHEEPEEQLHQQRHVAEEFDVAEADPGRGLRRQRAQDADDRAEHQRDDPGQQRRLDGQHQPRQQHIEIGAGPVRGRLEEDAPVPVIVHFRPRAAPPISRAIAPEISVYRNNVHANVRAISCMEGRACASLRRRSTFTCRNPDPASRTAWRTPSSARRSSGH